MNIYISPIVALGFILVLGFVLAAIIYIRKNWPEITIRLVANQIENIPGLEKVREMCLLSINGRLSLPAEMIMELVVMNLKNGNPYGIICEGNVLRQLRIAFPEKMDRVIRAFYKSFIRKLSSWKHLEMGMPVPELPTRRELEELFMIYNMSDRKEQLRLQQRLLAKLLSWIMEDIYLNRNSFKKSVTEEKRNLAEWIISHCKSHILNGYKPQEQTKKVWQFLNQTESRIMELQKRLDDDSKKP